MAKKQEKSTTIPTPVNIIWEKILFIPVFGTIDSMRAQEIMESMLDKLMVTGSKVIILDILGVVTVDSAVANHVIKITKATKLMGAETIISGMSPEIAQTLVGLGIELGTVNTTSTLADALKLAFVRLGLEVKKVK